VWTSMHEQRSIVGRWPGGSGCRLTMVALLASLPPMAPCCLLL
jgi:hypothetical protein